MKKISIKDIIDFRRKSDRAKKNFADAIKLDKATEETDGGGDYWISSLSAISNGFRVNNLKHINEKIDELEEKAESAEQKRSKTMYQRNIDILLNYEDFNFKEWRPSKNLVFIKKNKADSILTIKGLPIKVTPHHVFTFGKEEKQAIGAIWFIAKLNGYSKDDLGMFTDILYRYLGNSYSEGYDINPQYCIAVDVVENFAVNYAQIEKGDVSSTLNMTIDEIKKLM
jgi:hypothetical protein